MGIRLAHTHEDGKQCFVTRSRQRLTEKGVVQFVNPVTFKVTEYAVAYMPYTGMWYLYDLASGREVASMGLPEGRSFYEEVIKPHRIADLVEDPDCIPRKETV